MSKKIEIDHVVNLDRVLDDVVAEVVGLAVGDPRLGPAASHPHREIAAGQTNAINATLYAHQPPS
jgi:hypothetical protein